jgi:hypothetical protein
LKDLVRIKEEELSNTERNLTFFSMERRAVKILVFNNYFYFLINILFFNIYLFFKWTEDRERWTEDRERLESELRRLEKSVEAAQQHENELVRQRDENLSLKETIDKLKLDLEEIRSSGGLNINKKYP